MQNDLADEERISRLFYSSREVLAEYDRVGFCPAEDRLITSYFSNKNAKILDMSVGLGGQPGPCLIWDLTLLALMSRRQ